jgi:hypothetical protein
VVSWNCDSARPDSLNGEPQNYNFLNEALHSVDSFPDIIVFGFQEVIDLESRKMVAKNVLLGGKKKTDDGLSEKVTGAYKRWHDRLVLAVRAAMPKDVSYSVAHTESLIGLFSCIFVKNTERPSFDDVSITTIKRGMGGRYGNKVWFNSLVLQRNYLYVSTNNRVVSLHVLWLVIRRYVLSTVILLLVRMRFANGMPMLREC